MQQIYIKFDIQKRVGYLQHIICIYRYICSLNMSTLSPLTFQLIMNLFKFEFLEFLNIGTYKDHFQISEYFGTI